MASSLFGSPKQSNTMQTLMAAARAGKRPEEVLPGLAKQDPAVKQAMEIISGNAPNAVTGIIQNLAAKRGVTIPQLMQRMGLT